MLSTSKKNLIVALVLALFMSPAVFGQCPGGGTVIAPGKFEVNDVSAMEGNCGIEVIMDGTTAKAFVQTDTPTSETVYRVSFMINPNDMAFTGTGIARQHSFMEAKATDGNGIQRTAIRVQIIQKVGNYFVKFKAQADRPDVLPALTGQRKTANVTLEADTPPSSAHLVELEWQAASAAGVRDGIIRIRADGGAWQQNTVETFGWTIDLARFGVVAGINTGTTGSYYLDDFQSFRTLAP